MKTISLFLITVMGFTPLLAQEDERTANLVLLDETGVRNLGIETQEVVETDFEESIFALGRIAAIPSRHAVVSSRIAGRIVELAVQEGDPVTEGQVVARIESRQVGNPPPTIELTAPIGGLATESHVRLGEPVEPDREILDIIDLSKIDAIAGVAEDQARLLEIGTRARITAAALPGEVFEGELLRFGTVANRESGTLDAFFRITNPEGRLRPDMRAEFSIITSQRENVMAIPIEALQGDSANRVVYVKDFEIPHAFLKSPVVVGARNQRFAEIISGLFPGDEVVVKGAYPLAFAGGGSVSLKEALDAAHGHEHAEDGSELTTEREDEHGHYDEEGTSPLTLFFAGTSAVLFVLLILSLTLRRKNPTPA